MSRMKVVLREEVANLGQVGDVVQVAGGYARNYLIPRGMAVPATKGNVTQAETWKRTRTLKVEKERGTAEEARTRLEAAPVEIKAQAGPDGRLFGSITGPNIAEAVSAKTGVKVDRHMVRLPEPIKHLGFHEVEIRLHPEVSAKVTVEAVEGA